jgi:DNA polymerase III alpha subunit
MMAETGNNVRASLRGPTSGAFGTQTAKLSGPPDLARGRRNVMEPASADDQATTLRIVDRESKWPLPPTGARPLPLARRVLDEAKSMSVFCTAHPLTPVRPLMRRAGIITAADLRRTPSGRRVKVSGRVILVHTPPTRSGQRVMFVTLEDETGLMDVVVFPGVQAHAARWVMTAEVLSIYGELQRLGKGGRSISIVVKGVIRNWSGSLEELLPRAMDGEDDDRRQQPARAAMPPRRRVGPR